MQTKVINKLVRDNIPDIIRQNGDTCIINILKDKEEYKKALKDKLMEELNEFLSADTLEQQEEELVDIYEVILALLKNTDLNIDSFSKKLVEKALKNGRFDKKIYLTKVISE